MANHEIDDLLRTGRGVIRRRDYPDAAGTLDWALRSGRLVSLLSGLYTLPELRGDVGVRARAAALLDPDAVVTGTAAARLTYWPSCPVDDVSVALPWMRAPRVGYRFERHRLHPELVWHRDGIRVSSPSLTALQLADWDDSEALDRAFRLRVVSLDSLYHALRLTAGRAGNRQRRRLLLDSEGAPWSAAERRGHRLLRRAGITGWEANLPFRCADGTLFYLDIAFRREKLVVEIDGRIHLGDPELFERDRWRQNQLVLHGWRVLRFTWNMVVNHPDEVVAAIRAALRMAA